MSAEDDKKIANPPLISCEIEDLGGNKVRLEGRRITRKNLKDFLEMVNKYSDKPIDEILVNQMAWIFGGKPEDYDNYDIRVLKSAIAHFSDKLQNPI